MYTTPLGPCPDESCGAACAQLRYTNVSVRCSKHVRSWNPVYPNINLKGEIAHDQQKWVHTFHWTQPWRLMARQHMKWRYPENFLYEKMHRAHQLYKRYFDRVHCLRRRGITKALRSHWIVLWAKDRIDLPDDDISLRPYSTTCEVKFCHVHAGFQKPNELCNKCWHVTWKYSVWIWTEFQFTLIGMSPG